MRQARQTGARTAEDLTEAPLSRTRGTPSVHGMSLSHAVGVVSNEGAGACLGGGRQGMQAGPRSVPSPSQRFATGTPLS